MIKKQKNNIPIVFRKSIIIVTNTKGKKKKRGLFRIKGLKPEDIEKYFSKEDLKKCLNEIEKDN